MQIISQIVLASSSPRRQELLGQMGLHFTVEAADIDESVFGELDGPTLTETLSRAKAKKVAEGFEPTALVIGSDTVVELDGKILGKPENEADAFAMLTALSGKTHRVYTGVSLCLGAEIRSFHQYTDVRFRPLSEAEIHAYIQTGEPMDKAGSYGIQGFGSLFVAGIEGDFYTVMGLPVCTLGEVLKEFGLNPLLLGNTE